MKDLIKDIEKSKNIIAEERDKLRSIFEELQDLLDNLDEGIASIEEGIETISEKL